LHYEDNTASRTGSLSKNDEQLPLKASRSYIAKSTHTEKFFGMKYLIGKVFYVKWNLTTITLALNEYLPARWYASAVLSMALCLSVCLSVCFCVTVCVSVTSRCSAKMDGWIELVFGMEASFDLSYKKFKYLQNNGTSLWNFVPNSHTHFAMARVVNLARQRLTLSVKNWTVFGHCKLTILATASLSQRVCAWGSASRGSICDSWYLLDRPPVYMMSDSSLGTAGLSYSIKKLQRVQNNAARIVLEAPRRYHASPLLRTLHWLPVQQRIESKVALLTFKVRSTSTPSYLRLLIQDREHGRNLRSTNTALCQPFTTKTFAKRAFRRSAQAVWNSLLKTVLSSDSVAVFKSRLDIPLLPGFLFFLCSLTRCLAPAPLKLRS